MTATGTRAEARKALAGKWNKGALMALCYSIVESVLELIGNGLKNNNALFSAYQIIFFIISVPISYGFIISFVKLKRDESVEAFDFIKIGFNNFSKAWSIALNKFLIMIVPIIVMIVSFILIGVAIGLTTSSSILSKTSDTKKLTDSAQAKDEAQIKYKEVEIEYLDALYSSNQTESNYNELQNAKRKLDAAEKEYENSKNNPVNTSNNTSLVAFLSITGLIIYFVCIFSIVVKSLSLSLSSFIAYDNDNMSGRQSCKLSQKLMKGNKGNLFVLSLSFIGWALLIPLTLGIGSFWLTTYMNVSIVCFYETLANKDKDTEVSVEDKEELV